jgi:hypothetical protein
MSGFNSQTDRASDAIAHVLWAHVRTAGTPVSQVVLDQSSCRDTGPKHLDADEIDDSQSARAPAHLGWMGLVFVDLTATAV